MSSSLSPQSLKHDLKCELYTSNLPDDPEWDDFVRRSPAGFFTQTSSYSRAYHEVSWDVVRIILRDSQAIIAGVQILLKRIPLNKSIGRITFGPLFSTIEDTTLVDYMFSSLTKTLKKEQILFLAVQPGKASVEIGSLAKARGMYEGPDLFEPSNEVLIDLTDDIEAVFGRFKHDKRRDIRRSQKRAVTFRVGGMQDVEEFYRLHKCSSQRGGYIPYNLAFYNALWEGFSKKDEIHLFFTDFENRPLAGLITITNKDTLYAYKIGWSGERSDLYPNDALYWGAIQWAKQNHYKYFSMSGIDAASAMAYLAGKAIPEKRLNTYTRFKLQFGGEIILYTPTHYFSYNPFVHWISKRYFDTPLVSKSTNLLFEFVKLFRPNH